MLKIDVRHSIEWYSSRNSERVLLQTGNLSQLVIKSYNAHIKLGTSTEKEMFTIKENKTKAINCCYYDDRKHARSSAAVSSVTRGGGDQLDTVPGPRRGGPGRNPWPWIWMARFLGRYNDADNTVRQLKCRWNVISTLW
jgi:hypothetical protein